MSFPLRSWSESRHTGGSPVDCVRSSGVSVICVLQAVLPNNKRKRHKHNCERAERPPLPDCKECDGAEDSDNGDGESSISIHVASLHFPGCSFRFDTQFYSSFSPNQPSHPWQKKELPRSGSDSQLAKVMRQAAPYFCLTYSSQANAIENPQTNGNAAKVTNSGQNAKFLSEPPARKTLGPLSLNGSNHRRRQRQAPRSRSRLLPTPLTDA